MREEIGAKQEEMPHVDMPSLTIRYIDADELKRRILDKFGCAQTFYVPNEFAPGYHPYGEALLRRQDIIETIDSLMNPEYYSNRRVTSITVNYLPTREIYAYQLRDNPEYLAKIATRETLEAALRAQEAAT